MSHPPRVKYEQMSARIATGLRDEAYEKFKAEGISFSRWLELELWDWVNHGAGHPPSLEQQMQELWGRMDTCSRQRFLQWLQAQQ